MESTRLLALARELMPYFFFFSIIISVLPGVMADGIPPNCPASGGGLEDVSRVVYSSIDYTVHYRFYDDTRRVVWGHSIERGHRGLLTLNIQKSGYNPATFVWIPSPPSGIELDNTWKAYAEHLQFGFTVTTSMSTGSFILTVKIGDLVQCYMAFEVVGYVRSEGALDTDTPIPYIGLSGVPVEVDKDEEFSVVFQLDSHGNDRAYWGNREWANGLQIYLENAVFTRDPSMAGFTSRAAFDYDTPTPRSVSGAPIIELYDPLMEPPDIDSATLYLRATGNPGDTVRIKAAAWMADDDELVFNTMIAPQGVEAIYFRSTNGGEVPFNGEWGGTARFDDSAQTGSPMATISIRVVPCTVTFFADPTSGTISADDVIKYNGDTESYGSGSRVRVVANPPSSDYQFSYWETSVVSVDEPSYYDTYMTVSGSGWLKAHFNYVPPPSTLTVNSGHPNAKAVVGTDTQYAVSIGNPAQLSFTSPANLYAGADSAVFEMGGATISVLDGFFSSKDFAGVALDFGWWGAGNNENFVAYFCGSFTAPVDGEYIFKTTSDDGSVVWIDTVLVVNNYYQQGANTREGRIVLSKGNHYIRVEFEQGGGPWYFYLSWQPPNENSDEMPVTGRAWVYHSDYDRWNGNPNGDLNQIHPIWKTQQLSSSETWTLTWSTYEVPTPVPPPQWKVTITNKGDPTDFPTQSSVGAPCVCTADWVVEIPSGYDGSVSAILKDGGADTGHVINWTKSEEEVYLPSGTYYGSFTLSYKTPSDKNPWHLTMEVLLWEDPSGKSESYDFFEWDISVIPEPSYPSDRWERIWYVNDGDGSFGSYLGLGPDQSSLIFGDEWGEGIIAYGRTDYIGFISSRTIYVASGDWKFAVGTDDGVRVYIDDELVLDKWFNHGDTHYFQRTFPSAGNHRFRLEWYEQTLDACISFAMKPLLPDETYLVVRGIDNRIYYRVEDGTGWQSWDVLPGSTADSPAAAMLGNELHIVVRGSDGQSLWHGYLSDPGNLESFTGWTPLDGATSSAPTLTSNGTILCLVVRGLDNLVYHRCYASSWGPWHAVPTGATPDAPAAAMLGNDLHIVVRGMDGRTLWHTKVSCDGSGSPVWISMSGATPSRPVLTQGSGKLCLAVRGLENSIWLREYTSSWGSWIKVPTGTTCDGPGVVIAGNGCHIVVCGMDGNSLWYCQAGEDYSVFSDWTALSGSTHSAPTLAS